MTRRRFFCESLETVRGGLLLNPEVSHHVWRVLRHRHGDAVELCDGRGRTARAAIRGYHHGRVEVEVVDLWKEDLRELTTVLLVPWARADRMDLVVRQAVELGAGELWFFEAERSQYGMAGSQKGKRLSRYEKIAREALCQCGRAWLPQMRCEDSLEELLRGLGDRERGREGEVRLFAAEKDPRVSLLALRDRYPVAQRIIAAVGPEGGWENAERDAFQAYGFIPISLGRHVLRFETACTALLAAVEVVWGQAFHTEFQPAVRMETP